MECHPVTASYFPFLFVSCRHVHYTTGQCPYTTVIDVGDKASIGVRHGRQKVIKLHLHDGRWSEAIYLLGIIIKANCSRLRPSALHDQRRPTHIIPNGA